MAIIKFVLAILLLSILYKRMIDRETPAKISRKQAIVPVLLGILSVLLSFGFFLGFGMSMVKSGFSGKNLHPLLRSFLGAFIQAGFPEELAKLLMILLTVRLFRRTVTNVYEYILIGMAVGFGFTLFEEMIYGSDGAVFRLTRVAAHSALNMLMAKHLALAKYNRLTGRGSVAGENALARVLSRSFLSFFSPVISTINRRIMFGSLQPYSSSLSAKLLYRLMTIRPRMRGSSPKYFWCPPFGRCRRFRTAW